MDIRTDGLAERLGRALAHAKARDQQRAPEWSKHQLHVELKARNIRGSSWGSVRNYFTGKAVPPLDFLLEAATVLGVRPQYLVSGEGDLDFADAAERAAHDREVESFLSALEAVARPGQREEAFREGFGYHFGVDDPRLWSDAMRVWNHLQARVGDDVEAARMVGRALAAPLREVGMLPLAMSPWQLTHYVSLVAQALEAVLVNPAELQVKARIDRAGKD